MHLDPQTLQFGIFAYTLSRLHRHIYVWVFVYVCVIALLYLYKYCEFVRWFTLSNPFYQTYTTRNLSHLTPDEDFRVMNFKKGHMQTCHFTSY